MSLQTGDRNGQAAVLEPGGPIGELEWPWRSGRASRLWWTVRKQDVTRHWLRMQGRAASGSLLKRGVPLATASVQQTTQFPTP